MRKLMKSGGSEKRERKTPTKFRTEGIWSNARGRSKTDPSDTIAGSIKPCAGPYPEPHQDQP